MTCALRERCAPAPRSSAMDRLRRKARWNGWRSAMNGSSSRLAPSSATTATKRSVVGQVVNLRRIGNPPAALGPAAATFEESVSTVCGLPLCGAVLSSCARPGGYPGKRRSARVTNPPGPEGQPSPQHVVYASLAALALLRCSAQRFFCAAEMRLRAAALRTRLPPAGFGAADAAEGMALPFSVA